MKPPYAKKKRSLGSVVRQTLLEAKYRPHRVDAFFDYDWSKFPFDRATVVNKLVSRVESPAYLEIGCADNLLFDRVTAAHKVGVDPAKGGTHRMTSDAFFAVNRDAFDVVFIDGLHHYGQVRRDIVNALGVTPVGGWIALHDMLPRDWIEEHVPQIATSRWTGDGWKAAFELIASPDVDFRLVAIDHGVGVIRVLNEHATLIDWQAELSPKRFAWFRDHFAELPVVDWPTAEAWIEAS